MKSNSYNKTSKGKKFLFSNIFANIYYFFIIHLYIVLNVLASSFGIAILLLFAEFLFPKYIHFFGYSITDKMFSELVAENKYHAAVSLIEVNSDIFDVNNAFRLRTELASCYVHIGDYPKALEQYRILRNIIQEATSDNNAKIDKTREKCMLNMAEAFISKEEFNIYLKMGDKYNIDTSFKHLKEASEALDWKVVNDFLSENASDFFEDGRTISDIQDGLALELFQGEYILDASTALPKMEEYVVKTINSERKSYVYMLEVLNAYIGMLLEQDETIKARLFLEGALEIVDVYKYTPSIYCQLGKLSEYCFTLHDVENGRKLLKFYLQDVDEKYDEGDIEYIMAHSLEFKYLEKEGKWETLINRVSHTSQVIREQITNNFTGMTSAQREFFIAKFRPLFEYANQLLEEHPNSILPSVCFENNMFLRGLLLRSDVSVSNAISALNDVNLTNEYQQYLKLSQEFTARKYINGPGNYIRKRQLADSIQILETAISHSCRDFQRENNTSKVTLSTLQKHLSNNEIALQILEGKSIYYALVANSRGNVQYLPLCDKAYIEENAQNKGEIYMNGENATSLVGRLPELVSGKTVYYTTAGIFNKIALGAVEVGSQGEVLGDKAFLRLFNSIADLPEFKKESEETIAHTNNAVLWGGIYYDKEMAITNEMNNTNQMDATIERGGILNFLPGSSIEVDEIKAILKRGGFHVKIFKGTSATERSFTSRTGKKDYILHVSTHGFFDDNRAFYNSMQNAGLLFANSQQYWMNDSLSSSLSESDGILRADEIANMDLNGCRLVVLSACQTGLGTDNSEGVYGLQRAFKLAGAKNILMSLWNVDDRSTAELMKQMYSNLIKGEDTNTALSNAQMSMRRKGYSPDKWAAFILLN